VHPRRAKQVQQLILVTRYPRFGLHHRRTVLPQNECAGAAARSFRLNAGDLRVHGTRESPYPHQAQVGGESAQDLLNLPDTDIGLFAHGQIMPGRVMSAT
jgi:hypothetical protein